MTDAHSNQPVVNARVIYWGAQGSGKSTCIRYIYKKLRPDHRGELCIVASPVDANCSYEVLPVELGHVGGSPTRIQILVAPGAPEFRATRAQLLREVDGIIFVIDAQRNRMEANLASFVELRNALKRNGIGLEEIPLVIQHNKRDAADYIALEELHRRLALPKTPIFEGIATQGTGILEPLTTISKQVIRLLRESPIPASATSTDPSVSPIAEQHDDPAIVMEETRPADHSLEDDVETVRLTHDVLEQSAEKTTSLRIVSIGDAEIFGERALRIPLTLADSSGKLFELILKLDIGSWAEVEPR